MKMKRITTILAMLLLGSFLVVGNAMALSISIDDGNDGSIEKTVTDGGVDDTNLQSGIVSYAGTIGNWNLTSTTGTSAPQIGSQSEPQLDLFSLSLQSSSATISTIAVTVSDTYASYDDVIANIDGIISSVGGTTDGTVDLNVNINGFKTAILWDDMQKTGNAYSGSVIADLLDIPDTGAADFFMELTAVVTQAGGITTLDAHAKPVPEPATMLLLGLGIFGIGAVSRKKLLK